MYNGFGFNDEKPSFVSVAWKELQVLRAEAYLHRGYLPKSTWHFAEDSTVPNNRAASEPVLMSTYLEARVFPTTSQRAYLWALHARAGNLLGPMVKVGPTAPTTTGQEALLLAWVLVARSPQPCYRNRCSRAE